MSGSIFVSRSQERERPFRRKTGVTMKHEEIHKVLPTAVKKAFSIKRQRSTEKTLSDGKLVKSEETFKSYGKKRKSDNKE